MIKTLQPAVKTTIQHEGSVVFHDQTRHGLRRLCVMSREKYPDVEIWVGLLPNGADVKMTRYTEKEFSFYLWIYWKEKSNE